MTSLTLDPKTTALVLIDLQKGIASMPVVPHAAADVIARASALAAHCRARGVLVVLVFAWTPARTGNSCPHRRRTSRGPR